MYAERGFTALVRGQLETIHWRWFIWRPWTAGTHTETGQSYRSKQGMLSQPDTSNVREPLSLEGSSIRTLRRAGALGGAIAWELGWEAAGLCQREEGTKQRVDRKKYPDFFFLLPCLCQTCLCGQTQRKRQQAGTLDDTNISFQVGGTQMAKEDKEWKLGALGGWKSKE